MTTDPSGRLAAALSDRYRIERELGQGGMATVYLAHDVRHSRRVALKVLRPDLAAVLGAERFLAEIRTTANLQHPHILPLFDSGQADGFLFYVMPYVEGESLRVRLDREKQLPIADAIRVATEVAGALDYAHRHHVIHRDIKPENILLHDGQALVADFGIALAVSQAGAGSRMTETGLSLGTPHYMSPEQAMGERELTARSDVYALGAMTYEMLVGEPPFTGPSPQAILAKVVTAEPEPLIPQRKTIPPEVEAAVLTALEKLPADRFAGAAEFAAALAGETLAGGRTVRARRTGARSRGSRAPGPGAVIGLVLLAAAAGAGAWAWLRPRAPAGASADVLSVLMPNGVKLGIVSAPAVSPQGTRIAFIASDSLGRRLFVRDLGSPAIRPIPGTEGADSPFFSPDGRWVAFASGGALRKVDVVNGGAPEEIGGTAGTVDPGAGVDGGSWGSDGTLLYAPRYRGGQGLLRVPAAGGTPVVAALPDSQAGYIALLRPQFLPGGRNVLCVAWYRGVEWRIGVVSLATGKATILGEPSVAARYVDGRLVFARRDGTLYTAPFDPARGVITGTAARVPGLDGLIAAGLGLSDNGLLSYVSGTPPDFRLVAVDRRGAARPLSSEVRRFEVPRLSPDGRRIAIGAGAAANRDIWLLDRDRGTLTRLTFGGDNDYPAWAPDGRRVAAGVNVGGTYDVLSFAVDGTGAVDTLVAGQPYQFPGSWTPDEKWFVYRENSPHTNEDIFAVSLDGRHTRRTLAQSRFTEIEPALSPDGRWLAYVSDETGRREVYVRPFADEPGKWQISAAGGDEPAWGRNGRELFYRTPTRLMAAPVRAGAEFAVGEAAPLFDDGFSRSGRFANYDVLPGDSGFVMLEPVRGSAELRVVVNWKQLAAGR